VQQRARNGKRRERFHVSEFINPSGDVVFRVAGFRRDGSRVRENHRTEAEARGRQHELEIEAANVATENLARLKPTRLTAAQVREAEACFERLASAGHLTLQAAVDFYLANWKAPVTRISVADALDKFLADKRARNLRPVSLDNMASRTRALRVLHGHRHVDEITTDALKSLIHRDGCGPTTRNNTRRLLNNVFRWCVKAGYCAANPVQPIEYVKADHGEPDILSVAECQRLLDTASTYRNGALMPYLVLALFGAIRPAEVCRLAWRNVDLEAGVVTITGSMAKMRSRRVVQLSDNAVAMLRPFALRRAPITLPSHRKVFARLTRAAGFKRWTPDVLRHSGISYHLAQHQHEGQTATWAGNSPDIIMRHYRGLVRPAEAEAFWMLTTAPAANVVPLAEAVA